MTIRPALKELKTRYLEAFSSNIVRMPEGKSIISITFDDVPKTAMSNGIPILNDFDIKATFYIALGLSTNDVDNREHKREYYIGPDDIAELDNNHHDIGCHTYSHYMLNTGSAEKMSEDADKNTHELCNLLNKSSIDHFSYPFGQVNFAAKKLLGAKYKSLRSTRPGINTKNVDLRLLRAINFYSHNLDKAHISNLLATLARNGGWAIFYTHGISKNPDIYSCTPEDFTWLLKECRNSRVDILPISKAYDSIIKHSS